MLPHSQLIVKVVATLTVLVANIVVSRLIDPPSPVLSSLEVGVCILILYHLLHHGENTQSLVAVSCTLLLSLLVIITATLDNVSWWSNLFPDAFMSTERLEDLLSRLSVAEPGYKVTIQQGEEAVLLAGVMLDVFRLLHHVWR